MKIGKPSYVAILMYFHFGGLHPPISMETDTAKEAIKQFIKIGVITHETNGDRYYTTRLGDAWVEAITRVELPQTQYVDEAGQLLSE